MIFLNILLCRIFEMAPAALSLYSFGDGKDPAHHSVPDSIFQSPIFQAHAQGVVVMLETVLVMMLGNDMDKLSSSLKLWAAVMLTMGSTPPTTVS